jgi:hypothetical protein
MKSLDIPIVITPTLTLPRQGEGVKKLPFTDLLQLFCGWFL